MQLNKHSENNGGSNIESKYFDQKLQTVMFSYSYQLYRPTSFSKDEINIGGNMWSAYSAM